MLESLGRRLRCRRDPVACQQQGRPAPRLHLLPLGGILRLHDLIFDFRPAEAEAVLGAWIDEAADDPARGYTHDDFAQHLRTEFSTFRWLLEPVLAAAGFRVVTAEFDGRIYSAHMCIRT